ncbi:hypothetical protein Z948_858 [Sulfitobacter donghicola DSW-25 = KCTC 12864 = JCM 14565]|nr:hypothetical protein Z948_858 [Sulfitobacter donghicola DSW-25 = KCTC 12864 = JCM 14565]
MITDTKAPIAMVNIRAKSDRFTRIYNRIPTFVITNQNRTAG